MQVWGSSIGHMGNPLWLHLVGACHASPEERTSSLPELPSAVERSSQVTRPSVCVTCAAAASPEHAVQSIFSFLSWRSLIKCSVRPSAPKSSDISLGWCWVRRWLWACLKSDPLPVTLWRGRGEVTSLIWVCLWCMFCGLSQSALMVFDLSTCNRNQDQG